MCVYAYELLPFSFPFSPDQNVVCLTFVFFKNRRLHCLSLKASPVVVVFLFVVGVCSAFYQVVVV